jgi:transcriptional regulator with GAF, ATPase, and Fis domain
MKNYAWPGNVRELDHSVERGVLMAQGKVVRAPDLGLNAGQSAPRLDDMSLEEVEAFFIKKTLARCDGNARQRRRGTRPQPQRVLPPPGEATDCNRAATVFPKDEMFGLTSQMPMPGKHRGRRSGG